MPTDALVLLGAGGHGKVVLDAYRLTQPHARVRVYDDDAKKQGASFLGVEVDTPIAPYDRFRCACHVAIGQNATRRRIAFALTEAGSTLATVIHPGAMVARDSAIGSGVFVAAGAIVAPDARLGSGSIVNHAAIVDHECVVGDWCHIAPGVVLGGEVRVGTGCLVGSGAIVLPGLAIGDGAVIGAGAVVTRDVPAGATVVGNPGRNTNEQR